MPDENTMPEQLAAKGGVRRRPLCPITRATGRVNLPLACKAGGKSSLDEGADCQAVKAKAGKQPLQPKADTSNVAAAVTRNPSVIVKPVNSCLPVLGTGPPAAVDEFSIFCDESCDSDASQDEALDLSLVSTGGKGDASRLNDSAGDVFEAVGVHDGVLRHLSLDSSLRSTTVSPLDIESSPCSMRTAGKSAANVSILDVSQDAENIEPVCKKGRQSAEPQVDYLHDYDQDILHYMLLQEKQVAIDPEYMERQPEINAKMRHILVDWMVEVADEYKMDPETLFLAVSYIDRSVCLSSCFCLTLADSLFPGSCRR